MLESEPPSSGGKEKKRKELKGKGRKKWEGGNTRKEKNEIKENEDRKYDSKDKMRSEKMSSN